MLKIFNTLMRGAVAEVEEAVFDANAIRLLEQQIRDAATALELARRELACAMAHRASEHRAAEALEARISELEASGIAAIKGGRDDLAGEIATVIAANEDELAERQAAARRMDTEITRLRQLADDGRKRLLDLRRGLEMARAQDALRRAGASGRRAIAVGAGALRDAEATLVRIKDRQQCDDDCAGALDALDREASGKALDERLAEAGFGSGLKTKPADVLGRLRQSAAKEPPKP